MRKIAQVFTENFGSLFSLDAVTEQLPPTVKWGFLMLFDNQIGPIKWVIDGSGLIADL
jgi:hypothetical protein